MIDWLERWGFAALGAALVLVAALTNRFAPAKRKRIRRALFLYIFFVSLLAAGQVLEHIPTPSIAAWGEYTQLLAGVLAAYTSVEL
ncbi:MAG TPA: hypothetical protein VH044_00170, partial [Polyangiaceae bacterium]|nr:hypothetical protein [Polyangiaceae bacterium]